VTVDEIMAQLEALGDADRRAQNARGNAWNSYQGVGEKQYGVKLGDVRKVAKASKANHATALALWATGYYEARLAAILRMKPKALSTDELDILVREVQTAQVATWLVSYVIKKHPGKEALRVRWMQADNPWAARLGWELTAERVEKDPEGLDLDGLLDRIDAELPTADHRPQWTMNGALAGIGVHHPAHRERALAIGERHGVYRDYPTSKGCTSPFAPAWIAELVRRQTDA
jgi:3-methyladenine DNA glycosylase AlkD